MTQQTAKGTFQVQMQPLSDTAGDTPADARLGRMSLDKTFEGELVGVGKGEMLTAMTGHKGSAAYVAIERVTGTLHGRKGSFVFQHSGTMDRAAPTLLVSVVPDSGTGQLVGLSGTFKIDVSGGVHHYEFSYSLPA